MSENRRFAVVLVLVGWFLPAALAQTENPKELSESIDLVELEEHVTYLASDELKGRGPGEGAEPAREYIVDFFKELELEPAGEDGYLQAIGGKPGGANILAVIRGQDPELGKEYVILSAHYDHLGERNGSIYPGADDDASGIAALLEIARVLKEEEVSLPRSLLLIAFDLEEYGLQGSRHFVQSPTVPLEQIVLFINMDMLGRDMADILENYVFALGWEHSRWLKGLVREAAAGTGLKLGLVGTDVIGLRGDYGPFMGRRIPYLFFSTGESSDYHKPTDTADRILFPKLRKSTGLVLRTVLAAARLKERPAYAEPEPDIDEIRLFADVLEVVQEKAERLKLDATERAFVGFLRGQLEPILRRGKITKEEREQIREFVQRLALMMTR
ncbi:MAG: M20/M25/M40 family metallo-hydrolase [Planctomycetota bacterium]